MPVTARFDFSGEYAVKQGMPLVQPFAPEEPDGTRKDYTGYTATFALYAAPATVESLHDAPPILSLTDADGAVELGLMDGGDFGDYGILLYLTQQQTSVLSPWGRGVYNLDILDDFGRPGLRIRGVMELEEGTKHG